jgi:hypothetical protein
MTDDRLLAIGVPARVRKIIKTRENFPNGEAATNLHPTRCRRMNTRMDAAGPVDAGNAPAGTIISEPHTRKFFRFRTRGIRVPF